MWEKKGSGKSLAFLSLHVGIIREDGLSGGAENPPPPVTMEPILALWDAELCVGMSSSNSPLSDISASEVCDPGRGNALLGHL